MARRGRLLAGLAIAIVSVGYYGLAVAHPSGTRSLRAFEPDRLADLELDMWQAYYAHENWRLFKDLVVSLHEQNRYPWAKAAAAGFHLGRAAATFADLRSGYEQVLPDLEAAYATARDWTGAGFDPAAVSRAELAWWVARRVPGQNGADQVGALIADEYALLYERPREAMAHAALLRAQAGKLRDDGGAQADWPAVSRLLHESYRELKAGLQ